MTRSTLAAKKVPQLLPRVASKWGANGVVAGCVPARPLAKRRHPHARYDPQTFLLEKGLRFCTEVSKIWFHHASFAG